MDIADGAHKSAVIGTTEFLDRADGLGRAGQRIATERHRHRAGVPGHPGQPCREPRRARDCRDDANRQASLLQHRTLLDMEFEIAEQFAPRPRRRADVIGVEPEIGDRLAQGHSTPVPGIERAFVKRAGDRAAAEQCRGETNALLVGKAHHLDRKWQSTPSPVQVGNAGNRRDQAERTVPFAGVDNRVVMRAQHQAWQARTLALITAADIADRIELRAHAGLAHPAHDEVGSGAVLSGQEKPRQMLLALGDPAELCNPTNDLVAERVVLKPADVRVSVAHVFPMGFRAEEYKFDGSKSGAAGR